MDDAHEHSQTVAIDPHPTVPIDPHPTVPIDRHPTQELDGFRADGPPTEDLPILPRARPRAITLLAVVAGLAALAVIAGTLAGAIARRNRPPLVAAADATSAARTARFDLTVESHVTAALPSSVLDALKLPDSIHIDPPACAAGELPQLPGSGTVSRRIAGMLERMRKQACEAARDRGGITIPLPGRPAVELPKEIATDVSLAGSGEVAFPGRLHMQAAVDVGDDRLPVLGDGDGVELTMVGSNGWVRTPNGWLRLPGARPVLGTMLLDPQGAVKMLRQRRDGVTELGRASIDGVSVRRYRFSVPDGGGDAEAWVGESDDLLRKLVVRRSGGAESAVSWTSTTTLHLHDFGEHVRITPPDVEAVSGDATTPDGAGSLLFPFRTS